MALLRLLSAGPRAARSSQLALQPGNDKLCGPLPSHVKAVNVTSRLATQTITLQSCEFTPLAFRGIVRISLSPSFACLRPLNDTLSLGHSAFCLLQHSL